jgi:hypothetical protein
MAVSVTLTYLCARLLELYALLTTASFSALQAVVSKHEKQEYQYKELGNKLA